MGACGEGPFASDGALDWVAGEICWPLAGVIKRELEGFLDRKLRKRRMMVWEPAPAGTPVKIVRGRKLRGGRSRIEYMMGRGRGHDTAEAAIGLLDELTPYQKNPKKPRRAKKRSGRFPVIMPTHRMKVPVHLGLHYEAEELHLYSLAVQVLREIINDSAYISCWKDPAGKRVVLHDLALAFEAKVQYERVKRPLAPRMRSYLARMKCIKLRRPRRKLSFG